MRQQELATNWTDLFMAYFDYLKHAFESQEAAREERLRFAHRS
jgi:hypothetical protein